MLYIGAVEGEERWLRPDQVTRMTDAQAALQRDAERDAWLHASMRPANVRARSGGPGEAEFPAMRSHGW